jgi:hypothetical protein
VGAEDDNADDVEEGCSSEVIVEEAFNRAISSTSSS